MRVQRDPERSLLLEPLDHRAIQIGLSGDAARHYVNDWTVGISDITALTHVIHALVNAGDLTAAAQMLPTEHVYPLPDNVRVVVGAT